MFLGVFALAFIAGIVIEQWRSPWVLWLCLGTLFAPLFVTKYFDFATSVFGIRLPAFRAQTAVLPIGISFYTFTCVGYLIDVYRRNVAVERSISRFYLFIGSFTHVVAGPIARFKQLSPQLWRMEKEGLAHNRFSYGFALVGMGLFLKTVVSDNLGAFVDSVYANPGAYTDPDALRAAYDYTLQIYSDVYGYTLIALGSGHMLGLDLINNFNHPYFATDIQEFWKRWHISLTTWFRDYLYFPLSLTRAMRGHWIANLLITFLLTGLWHGANWTFVAWGGLNGVALAAHRVYRRRFPAGFAAGLLPAWLLDTIGIAITFHFVTLEWVLFRAANFKQAGLMLGKIFAGVRAFHVGLSLNAIRLGPSATYNQWFYYLIFAGGVLLLLIDRFLKPAEAFERAALWQRVAVTAALTPLFFLSSPDAIQFIYFQF